MSFDPDAPATGGGLFGLEQSAETARVVVVGVPFEATTSFGRGTAAGPDAILAASWQVDLHDLETGEPWQAGIAMLPIEPSLRAMNEEACALAAPIIAAGGATDEAGRRALDRVNGIGAALNQYVHRAVASLLDEGRIPAVLGGDHSVPFGAIQAAAERHPGIGVLHVDAHADLREAYEGFTWSHASILYNVLHRVPGVGPVVQVGLRDVGRAEHALAEQISKVSWYTDADIGWRLAGGETWQALCERMINELPDEVWITWDIDGLDPSLCPNTGTPVPGGLSWRDAMVLLRTLVQSGKRIVGFDLVEVSGEAWDANVGARLLYRLAGFAIESQGR